MVDTQHMHDMRNLQQVRRGVCKTAPGIRRCADCRYAFIGRGKTTKYCDQCRDKHTITCKQCGVSFIPDTAKTDRCRACQHQEPLFDTENQR